MIHKSTAQVCELLNMLEQADDWVPTRALAERAEVPRSTASQALEELAGRGWVEERRTDAGRLWRLGPELPRIGLAYQSRLVAEAAELKRRFEHSLSPIPPSLLTEES